MLNRDEHQGGAGLTSMRFLFVHQNFPGQYLHVARRLAADRDHDVTFLSAPNANQIAGVRKVEYKPIQGSSPRLFKEAVEFEAATIRARSVAATAETLASVGYVPDIMFGHNGWGETLDLNDVWPNTPLVPYYEFYYHERGLDVDFDPEFPIPDRARSAIRMRNAVNLLGLANSDHGQTPTRFQHETYPAWARERIQIIPEGVDLDLCRPDPAASFGLPSLRRRWRRSAKPGARAHRRLVTFVARHLEPYRGFHTLMRALPRVVAARPDIDVIVVGGDEVSYGAPAPRGSTWRQRMMDEVGEHLPPDRVFFPGQLPYADYVALLKTSIVHVYLTYPFVLSWSLREAMACGCAIVGSDTAPVREFIGHRRTGLLAPFHDPVRVAQRILTLLDDDVLRERLAENARRHAERKLGLERQFAQLSRLVRDVTGKSISV